MNLTNASPGDFSGLSNLLNSSLANLTITSFNQTASIITALSSSGGRTWDLKYYWIFTIPFLLSVPFFLVAGGILRWSIRSAVKYAVYWRIAMLFVGPIIYLGFYWALPTFGWSIGYIVYVVLNYGGFGLFAGFKLWRAFRTGSDRLVWTFFFVLIVVFCIMDAIISVPYGIPVFMLFPWAFLLWRSRASLLLQRWFEKKYS